MSISTVSIFDYESSIVDLDMMEHLRFRRAKKERTIYIPPARVEHVRIFPFSYNQAHLPFNPTYGRSVTVKVSFSGYNPTNLSQETKAFIVSNTKDSILYQLENKEGDAFSFEDDEIVNEKALSDFSDDAVFKVMISPDDPKVLTKDYIRKIMRNLELQSGYSLKWVAAMHYNTAHPHAHIIISRTSGDSRLSWETPLKLDRRLISEGIRKYSQELSTRILGRKSLEEYKKPFNESVYNHGHARIDWIIKGNKKNPSLLVPTADGELVLSKIRMGKLPIWQQILIEKRLLFLAENSKSGFYSKNGNWYCNEPNTWFSIIDDEGKLSAFSNLMKNAGKDITIIRHNKPLDRNIEGEVISKAVVDENSSKIGLVIKENGSEKLFYVETTLSHSQYESIIGQQVSISPRKANTERYRVPEVHIKGVGR